MNTVDVDASSSSSKSPVGNVTDATHTIRHQEVVTVAAVDTSTSTYGTDYTVHVNRVLKTLTAPLTVIEWNSTARLKDYISIPETFYFVVKGCTRPVKFMELLQDFDKPINLYIFSDGLINDGDVTDCETILQEHKNIIIHNVHLYYFGNEQSMNLKFINIFKSIPTTIHVNEEHLGAIDPQFDFENVDFDYIMKDDSFKATVLLMFHSPGTDKGKLKRLVCEKSSSILKSYFEDRLSIEQLYESKDVEGCVKYVKEHSYYVTKCDFQRKISDILKIFDPRVDSYSISSFRTASETTELTYEEPDLECEYLTCDVLYEHCKTGCIPIKKCTDDIWLNKKVLQNPFALLESKSLVKRVVDMVEPYIMDYDKVYKRIDDPRKETVSPFSRDVLKGAYVLNNGSIKPTDLIRHNNYVLSTFFQNKLPGKDVLWHMIFLYILAQKRFPELKERLYEEIRFLGKQRQYFLSLNPHLNPPIVQTLDICFWYIAEVSHRAFPNSKKNILRSSKFNPMLFLDFYKDVYDPDYKPPEDLPLWLVWKALCCNSSSILPILSHYFESEKLQSHSDDPFQYILYKTLKSPDERVYSEGYSYLAKLDLETVLKVYGTILDANHALPYDEIKLKEPTIELKMIEPVEDKLDHVRIHLRTCHPLVTCPETGRHWRDCVGEYDIVKESNLRLFRKYCMQYGEYPSGWKDLLAFQNKRLYKRQDKIPELFPYSIRKTLERVMGVFKNVMSTYPCKLYLECAEQNVDEEGRMKIEEQFVFDDPPDNLTQLKKSKKKKNKGKK